MATEFSEFIFGVHTLQGAGVSLIHATAGINHLASGAWKWKHGHLVQIRQSRGSAKYFRTRTKSAFYSNRLEQKWREWERASRRVDYLRFSCQRALAKWREYIKKSARRYPAAPCRRCIFISHSHTVYIHVCEIFLQENDDEEVISSPDALQSFFLHCVRRVLSF